MATFCWLKDAGPYLVSKLCSEAFDAIIPYSVQRTEVEVVAQKNVRLSSKVQSGAATAPVAQRPWTMPGMTEGQTLSAAPILAHTMHTSVVIGGCNGCPIPGVDTCISGRLLS